VSVTNGDAGHQSQGGGALAARRRAEAQEAGRRLGIAEYETLDNHDGELVPSLHVREQIIRRIRQWGADVVLGPRPNDYHPDHCYTGVLLQDAAYMVVVPRAAALDSAGREALLRYGCDLRPHRSVFSSEPVGGCASR
jgi:LmbE family N-acetylglucosaminyl deacetylase